MTGIGPTPGSGVALPSRTPPSVSVMSANPTPFSAGPRIGGADSPSVCSDAPPNRPWLDSTRPIAASSDQSIEHGAPAAACRYASSAVSGMPLAVSPDTSPTGCSATGRADADADADSDSDVGSAVDVIGASVVEGKAPSVFGAEDVGKPRVAALAVRGAAPSAACPCTSGIASRAPTVRPAAI